MNRFIVWVLVAVTCVGVASSGSAQAQWNDPAVVAALKQIEQDMGDAMVAVDIEKLNEYVWMDLMEKRNGTWVIVRTSGAKVR